MTQFDDFFLNGVLRQNTIFGRGEYSVRVPAGPCRLSFFKIWLFLAEFHITYMYLAKIMLLRENLLFMAEFFNSQQKLCQGTND